MNKEQRDRGSIVSNFLSGIAVILSLLSLGFSGFTAYQVFTLQEKIAAISNNASTGAVSENPPPETTTAPVSPAAPDTTGTAPAATGIQPGQFVQSAVGNKGQVELLAVKRIADPESKTRDVVNVQMRLRRLAAEVSPATDAIYVAGTKARNPDTSETYEAVSYKRSSGTVNFYSIRRNASSDAYVWLRIPEGVTAVDIFIPDTGEFKNVPIAN